MSEQINLHTVETIAKVLELTPRRVYHLADSGHIPKPDKGNLPLIPCVQGYIRYLRAQKKQVIVDDSDTGTLVYAEENARLTREKRIEKELKNAESAGLLVKIDDARLEMAALAKMVVNTLETLPDILEREAGMTPEQIEKAGKIIDATRQKLYESCRE